MNTIRAYSKAILAFVFGLSPLAIVNVLRLFHVHLDEATVTAILTFASPLLAAAGVAVGPANKPKDEARSQDVPEVHEAPAEIVNSWFES
ncbi:hypothetical protein [Amycolatopsis lexingtonensis]|uniref:hypothetical protein n=1 Tax=Amycolatopsis lexingtonensis TaxID=218822 RepID=UPI003F72E24A